MIASIIKIVWQIWTRRNKLRFENLSTGLHAAINFVKENAALTSNHTPAHMFSIVEELSLLKAFKIRCHPRCTPKIKEVTWIPPKCGRLKCNIDDSAKGYPGPASVGGIFEDSNAAVLGCFAASVGVSNSLIAELSAAMLAIEIALEKGWNSLWLECDSSPVVHAFSSSEIVPLKLRAGWKHYIDITKSMRFMVSHIFRGGNSCVDCLASYGASSQGFTWWDLVPDFFSAGFYHDRFSLLNYRLR